MAAPFRALEQRVAIWLLLRPKPEPRLLRQSGGFEGVGLLGEAIDSHDEAVSKGVESWKLALDLDAFPAPEAP